MKQPSCAPSVTSWPAAVKVEATSPGEWPSTMRNPAPGAAKDLMREWVWVSLCEARESR